MNEDRHIGAMIFSAFLCFGLVISFILIAIVVIGPEHLNLSMDVFDSSSKRIEELSAAELIEIFKDEGLPIGQTLAYTEETDTNGLLGKQGEYIEKIDFEDTSAQSSKLNKHAFNGGTIEVFLNAEDAQARYNYINAIGLSGSLGSYMYLHKNVLVRVDMTVNAQQAQKYDDVLSNLDDGTSSQAL